MATTSMAMPMASGPYPVTFNVIYPPGLSRWLLFLRLFFFWALVIPFFFVAFGAAVLLWLSWFAIMNDGRYPRLLIKPVVWYLRISARLTAYLYLLTDRFPLEEEAGSPVTLDVTVPDRTSRLSTFFRWLLVIPHLIVLFFIDVAWFFVTFIAWFAILFTGRYPRGLFGFSAGVLRWTIRVNAYQWYLVDEYPPFSLE